MNKTINASAWALALGVVTPLVTGNATALELQIEPPHNLEGQIHDCYNEGEPELSGQALQAKLEEADQLLAEILAHADAARTLNDVEPPAPSKREGGK